MAVTRYRHDNLAGEFDPTMEEHHSGDYVKYDDYEELRDQLVDTQVKLKWLENKIKALAYTFKDYIDPRAFEALMNYEVSIGD